MTRVVLSLPALLLAAGAPAQPVSQQATLTLTNVAGREVVVQRYRNGADCSGGRLDFAGSQILKHGERREDGVGSDGPQSFLVHDLSADGGRLRACSALVSFDPVAGGRYDGLFTNAPNGCRLVFQRVVDGRFQPEPTFRQREPNRPFLDGGAFCKPES